MACLAFCEDGIGDDDGDADGASSVNTGDCV